jgi:putative nucleotidyltransferase with HDIG domain
MMYSEDHSLGQICYRANQFLAVLRKHKLKTDDFETVRRILSDPQMALFNRLHPSEQNHSLKVLKTLIDQGETHPDLLTAALLHDIGKIQHPLRLWERVVIVLAKQFIPGRVDNWVCSDPKGWNRPFVIAKKHPQWGADLALQVDAAPLVIYLIKEHQTIITKETSTSQKKQLLSALQAADKQN